MSSSTPDPPRLKNAKQSNGKQSNGGRMNGTIGCTDDGHPNLKATVDMMSPGPVFSSADTNTIPIREWTNLAIVSAHIALDSSSELSSPNAPDTKKKILSSEVYLVPALKIAHSLTKEACKGRLSNNDRNGNEEEKKCSSGSSGESDLLPSLGSDLSDHVVVCLGPSQNNGHDQTNNCDQKQEGNSSSAGVTGSKPSSCTKNDSNSKCAMDPNEFALDTTANRNGIQPNDNDNQSYLDVQGAEILPSFKTEDGHGTSSEIWQIYSLGLVLYELFSGGEMPPDLEGFDTFIEDDLSFDLSAQLEQEEELHSLGGSLHIDDDFHDDDDDILNTFEDEGLSPDQQRNKKQACNNHLNQFQSTDQKSGRDRFLASVEPLRRIGLPDPLFELICNMIDSANGDFRGEESYNLLSDVLRDLQLMLEKPKAYLHGIDLTKVSMEGLQLDKTTLLGRDAELASLQRVYERSVNEKGELAIISGASGTGKSTLARQLARTTTQRGGIFLSGKFDQLKTSQPFSAIAEAFNEYCDLVEGSADVATLARELKSTLGQGILHLAKVIPSLGKIVGEDTISEDQEKTKECADPQKRLQYHFCQFVDVISRNSEITLFLDDLQWGDPASIDVINRILLASSPSNRKKHFFFLGCCRKEAMNSDHPVSKMVSGVRFLDVETTIINLECFDKDMVNAIISELLCLSPRLTRSLSDIVYHKTKGNPLFFYQLMQSLHREDLLRFSLSRRRWEWEIDKIQLRKLPDNVAEFFTNTIGKLPEETQLALFMVSCFGASVDCAVLKTLEIELGQNLNEPLDLAMKEGLVNQLNEKYCFVHDRIQEAAYNVVSAEKRPQCHFNYGLALYNVSLKSGNDNFLFAAIGQINYGGPTAVADEEQGVAIAELNLIAANRATGMSDFSSAFSFVTKGISYLRTECWNRHYRLTLELFDTAVKCSLVIADFDSLRYFSNQVFSCARTFEDKLNSLYVTTSSLFFQSQVTESVDRGIAILSQLGEDLPTSFSELDFNVNLEQTKSVLSVESQDDLLLYRAMTDFSKMMAMKFLAQLQSSLFIIRPELQPFVSLKMVQLSLDYGMSPVSPIGFAYYGSLLGSLGNIRDGYRYVKIAKCLLDRFGSREVAGEVFVVSTHVIFFVEPAQSANDYFNQGFNIAMAAGDMCYAMLNKAYYVCFEYWMGVKLSDVKARISDAHRLMEQQDHLIWFAHLVPLERTVSVLIGNSADTNQTAFTESPADIALLKKNPHQSMNFYFQKMYISFLFRKYNETEYFAGKYFDCEVKGMLSSFIHAQHVYVGGLVSFWLYRKTLDMKWFERGKTSLSLVTTWSEFSQWNFGNKKFGLEAERHFCERNFQSAKAAYDKAISTAKEHRFVHEEALSCELAGHFFFELGNINQSEVYLTKAHKTYLDWGALSKAALLEDHFQLLSDAMVSNQSASSWPNEQLYSEEFNGTRNDDSRKRGSLNLYS